MNLFSTGAIDGTGLETSSKAGVYRILRNKETVAMGHKQSDNLWILDVEVVKPQKLFNVRTSHTIQEWHELLGHACGARIRALASQGLIEVAPGGGTECGYCVAGKGKRASHLEKVEARATEPGESVYRDLAHLNKSESDYCYYMLCKDEATKHCFRYPAERKTELPSILRRLFIDFEIGCGRPIQTLVSDNAYEMTNRDRDLEMLRQGTRHFTTSTYAPQQDVIVEREVQSLNNMARTMLP